jgi:pyruvate/2-oxoglutarate dehydrogenase complex dihydrolipoamide dehydrogenase (E3) component
VGILLSANLGVLGATAAAKASPGEGPPCSIGTGHERSQQGNQLLVIGGGPGGYPAALHAADHGIKPILVDEGPKLGGVCTNRGCIPSKALLHVAKLIEEAKEAAEWGVSFGSPKFDLPKLQSFVQQKSSAS